MRLALISDIHGNAIALDAVLADIKRQGGVEQFIFLGDSATIGPQPRQVLDRLQEIGARCIMGNHDACLMDLEAAKEYMIARPIIPMLHWCAEQLTGSDFAYLKSFVSSIEISLNEEFDLFCFHGTPRSNIGIILATTPAKKLEAMLRGQKAQILAGGHTHIQMLRQHYGRWVINPGSVGSAFARTPNGNEPPTLLPWAEYAMLGVSNGVINIDLRRVPFDHQALSEAVRQSGIPQTDAADFNPLKVGS